MIFDWITRSIPLLRKVPNLSLSARVAWTMFFFLLLIYAASALGHALGGFEDKPKFFWILAGILVLATPFVVYHFVRLLTTKVQSKYPEIDQIWNMALEECQQNGISITNVPVFLILGARDLHETTDLIKGTELEHTVKVPLKGKPDIAVFADRTAIFVSLPGCSCLSRLATPPPKNSRPDREATEKRGPPDGFGLDRTLEAHELGGSPTGTAPIYSDDQEKTLGASELFGGGGEPPVPDDRAFDTIPLSDDQVYDPIGNPIGIDSFPIHSRKLDPQEEGACNRKLRYVCQLICSVRKAICPINGLISVVPFQLVEHSHTQVQEAARTDLAILSDELKVRCQNVVMVSRMIEVPGFDELVKRMGDSRTMYRFGKGATLWSEPNRERLSSVAFHAVGAFEDWIYKLFQEKNALTSPHNSKLFMLLCRVRRKFANNLSEVLAGGFASANYREGTDQDGSHKTTEPFLFGGCYFGSADASLGNPAFIKSVFEKVIKGESQLEWTVAARKRNQSYLMAANWFALLGLVSIVAIIAMLVYHFRK